MPGVLRWFWDLTVAVDPLQADLRRITDGDAVDIPQDALLTVMQASFSADARKEIMAHVQDCMTSVTEWRRVHCSLELLDQLLQHGSKQLLREASEGVFFDVVQRLTFLESFTHAPDERVQQMVRKKAGYLRKEFLSRTDTLIPLPIAASEGWVDRRRLSSSGTTGSTESLTMRHIREPSTPDSMSNNVGGSPQLQPHQRSIHQQNVYVNNVALVGHRDDTSSESGASDTNDSSLKRQGLPQPSAVVTTSDLLE
mmetsp:Transcript_35579/g.83144  ORF Transcript_35579/g.83144 Transcript_35579/m.83144 type:complete len:254 (-) Transcript_35579:16-777(-)